MPLVSVLLPTHNRADVALLAVESVLAQTESDFELLVVADGCTDDTCARIAALRDPRIRIFDLPKAPHFGYANRNIAFREARGRYIAFAAHDDLLFPDHLSQLVRAIESSGAEWLYSRPLWVSADGIVVPYAVNLLLADERERFLTQANSIPASCVLHTRECFARYGYWPEDAPRAADWLYWRRVIEGGGRARLAYLPVPTCLHFVADWKQSRHSLAGEVQTWLEIADSADWWPAALRYAPTPGAREQAVIADAIRTGGDAWMRAIRAAVTTAIDRVAWEDICALRTRARDLERERVALTAEIASLHARAGRLSAETEELARQLESTCQESEANRARATDVLSSTSWRVTAPLRRMRAWLARR